MAYSIETTKKVDKQIEKFAKSGNKALVNKIHELFIEIAEHPRTGTGQVEQLKHYPFKQTWSRRLNQEYRLVYEIHDEIVTVKVISAADHYGDK
jgi:toxin YoeB